MGYGTLQATLDIAQRGALVVSLEPGSELIIRARQNLVNYSGVSFINSKFEDAELPSNTFDIVCAAQSFHWIDEHSGYHIVSTILKSQGFFAALWKPEAPNLDLLHKELDKMYENHLDDYNPTSVADYEIEVVEYFNSLVRSKQFVGCQLRRYFQGSIEQDANTFVGAMSNWSKIAVLEPHKRDHLLREMRKVIERQGGNIVSVRN